MGSDAEHVLRISPVPVLLVKAPDEAPADTAEVQDAAARPGKACAGNCPSCTGAHAH
jgi:hypothetical protein